MKQLIKFIIAVTATILPIAILNLWLQLSLDAVIFCIGAAVVTTKGFELGYRALSRADDPKFIEEVRKTPWK